MAFGIDDAIAAGLKIVDKFIPDPELKAKMAQELENNRKDMMIANLEADNKEAEELTKRWQADLTSDSWLAKNIRPMTLIFILVAYFFFGNFILFEFVQDFLVSFIFQSSASIIWKHYLQIFKLF